MVLSQESYTGFKKRLLFWKAKLLPRSVFLFKLFSCYPEAATPCLAAKHRVKPATQVFRVAVTKLTLEWLSFMCYTGGHQ